MAAKPPSVSRAPSMPAAAAPASAMSSSLSAGLASLSKQAPLPTFASGGAVGSGMPAMPAASALSAKLTVGVPTATISSAILGNKSSASSSAMQIASPKKGNSLTAQPAAAAAMAATAAVAAKPAVGSALVGRPRSDDMAVDGESHQDNVEQRKREVDAARKKKSDDESKVRLAMVVEKENQLQLSIAEAEAASKRRRDAEAAITTVDAAMKSLFDRYGIDGVETSVSLIVKVLEAIAAHPTDPKYCTLQTKHDNVQRAIMRPIGALVRRRSCASFSFVCSWCELTAVRLHVPGIDAPDGLSRVRGREHLDPARRGLAKDPTGHHIPQNLGQPTLYVDWCLVSVSCLATSVFTHCVGGQ